MVPWTQKNSSPVPASREHAAEAGTYPVIQNAFQISVFAGFLENYRFLGKK